MKIAGLRLVAAGPRLRVIALFASLMSCWNVAGAAGTPAGTVIENTASVTFDFAGTPTTVQTNTTTLTVVERIDVVVTLQSPQVIVAANETGRALLFNVTNTGNGTEEMTLAIQNAIAGDDFDPVEAVPAIYFDSDASGDFTAADEPYEAGVNNPVLAADESVDVFLVNDIPGGVDDADLGRSQLTATAITGTGAPGTEFAGQGDGGVDAILGSSGGEASGIGEYLVSEIQIEVLKSQSISDPFGGIQPVPGATITYTITIQITNSGAATAAVLEDPIPPFTTYVPDSLAHNGTPLTDVAGDDSGEYDSTVEPRIIVRLGDMTSADGIQTVEFDVTID